MPPAGQDPSTPTPSVSELQVGAGTAGYLRFVACERTVTLRREATVTVLGESPGAVGVLVRRARMRRSLSQSDLAANVGVTREWVGRLESGAPRLEFDKDLRTLATLGIQIQAPADEVATSADIELADEIAWSMALEGRRLTGRAYDKLLEKIAADRRAREGGVLSG